MRACSATPDTHKPASTHLELSWATANLVHIGQRATIVGLLVYRQPQLLGL